MRMRQQRMPLVEAGHVVGRKYQLVGMLGRGSMGEVWLGHHLTLRERVAVKLLARGIGDDEEESSAAARFRFEAQVAARLSRQTRHIVRVTDHGEEDGLAYLVMELLEGQTLANRLLLRERPTLGFVTRLVAQIARALVIAHTEGVVHRDLKPANVFLTQDEDGQLLVKLLDFGIARTMHTRRVAPSFRTADGVVFGTPGYMSPEQARAAKPDAGCDLWALASVAYEALTGEIPVLGASTEELVENTIDARVVRLSTRAPEWPDALSAFFDRAFAASIQDRYINAQELAAAFERATGADVSLAPAPVAARVSLAADTLWEWRAPAPLQAETGSAPAAPVGPPPPDPSGVAAVPRASVAKLERRAPRGRVVAGVGAGALLASGIALGWCVARGTADRDVSDRAHLAPAPAPASTPEPTARVQAAERRIAEPELAPSAGADSTTPEPLSPLLGRHNGVPAAASASVAVHPSVARVPGASTQRQRAVTPSAPASPPPVKPVDKSDIL